MFLPLQTLAVIFLHFPLAIGNAFHPNLENQNLSRDQIVIRCQLLAIVNMASKSELGMENESWRIEKFPDCLEICSFWHVS